MKLTHIPLRNGLVHLVPLADAHREGLRAAGAHASIWTHWSRDVSDWDSVFDKNLAECARGERLLYTVFDPKGAIIGQTAYLTLRPTDAGVEIGNTWYTVHAQGGAVNPAAKLLLLAHAFACGAERVELKTDARNARSRAAIAKLGAVFEGVHRKHMRIGDGTLRDSAYYSIIRDDWPAVRAGLESRLAAFG
jgi:RimJ/RimL family protein N-acetyltransferase